jgi:antitoxin MazE
MGVTIQKWGNSHAVRLPKAVVDQSGLKVGVQVQIEAAGGVITIRPTRRRKRIPMKELIRGMTPAKNRFPEFEDAPKGKELL